jgi:hypothetical protein
VSSLKESASVKKAKSKRTAKRTENNRVRSTKKPVDMVRENINRLVGHSAEDICHQGD